MGVNCQDWQARAGLYSKPSNSVHMDRNMDRNHRPNDCPLISTGMVQDWTHCSRMWTNSKVYKQSSTGETGDSTGDSHSCLGLGSSVVWQILFARKDKNTNFAFKTLWLGKIFSAGMQDRHYSIRFEVAIIGYLRTMRWSWKHPLVFAHIFPFNISDQHLFLCVCIGYFTILVYDKIFAFWDQRHCKLQSFCLRVSSQFYKIPF